MPKENLSAEEVFADDKDPLEAIAELRKEEADDPDLEVFDAAEADIHAEIEKAEAKVEVPEVIVKEDEPEKKKEEEKTEDERKVRLEKETDKEHGKIKGEEETPEKKEEAEAKAKVIEVIKRKFKANGQEFEFSDAEILDQFEGVFGKAMDYTQKMQKISPYRKMISALEKEEITQEQFNLALDILKGDKDAIKQLAKDRKIDLSDLSFEDTDTPYTPTDHGDNDFQIQLKEIESTISSDPEFKTTVDVIDNQWDDGSRKMVAENPKIILGLHNDIKSGVYSKVAPEALKLQMLDGNSKSSLDYYLDAGATLKASLEAEETEVKDPQKKVDDLNRDAQEAETKFSKESSEAEEKRAATSSGASSGKKGVVDYLDDDNDEKFDAWYKNLEASI